MDACPGRLNRIPLYIKREGLYFGQCSEICGILHGFMPIVIKAVNIKDWVFFTEDEFIKNFSTPDKYDNVIQLISDK